MQAAVGLDDQAARRPVEVDRQAGDHRVDERAREPREPLGPRACGVRGDDALDRGEVEEAQPFGTGHRPLELVRGDDLGEIEQRAGRRRDGQGVEDRRLERLERHPVGREPSARPASGRVGIVTSYRPPSRARSLHVAAADPWLSTALGPKASTAAMRRPQVLTAACPTA